MDTEKINCPVFKKQERITKGITDKINKSAGAEAKMKYAEELLKEVNAVLSCPDYKSENPDCTNCRTIAGFRKQTAELIIKLKKLV